METALALDRVARDAGYELRVIGIPKTIDNDIAGTDHTPGYASCARFFAHAVRDVGEDNRALPPPVEIIEVLGRNVGWVAAATALARHYDDDPPHLIYFPECGITPDQLCADVERVYRRAGRCLVAVCEGQKDRGRRLVRRRSRLAPERAQCPALQHGERLRPDRFRANGTACPRRTPRPGGTFVGPAGLGGGSRRVAALRRSGRTRRSRRPLRRDGGHRTL